MTDRVSVFILRGRVDIPFASGFYYLKYVLFVNCTSRTHGHPNGDTDVESYIFAL